MSLLDLWGKTHTDKDKYDSNDTDALDSWTPDHQQCSQHPSISFLDNEDADDNDEENGDLFEDTNEMLQRMVHRVEWI